jgi:anti-sigma factor RsiW
MQGDDTRREPPAGLPDRALWQRSRMTDASEDEAERAFDLAGFADERLDPDDRERVAEWFAGDPLAAGDVAAARALAAQVDQLEAAPEPVIARACALVGGVAPQRGMVVAFRIGRRDRSRLRGMAGWGSLVAATAVASWLGFTLGMDTSLWFGPAGEDGFLSEMLDPGAGFMRELTEGTQT